MYIATDPPERTRIDKIHVALYESRERRLGFFLGVAAEKFGIIGGGFVHRVLPISSRRVKNRTKKPSRLCSQHSALNCAVPQRPIVSRRNRRRRKKCLGSDLRSLRPRGARPNVIKTAWGGGGAPPPTARHSVARRARHLPERFQAPRLKGSQINLHEFPINLLVRPRRVLRTQSVALPTADLAPQLRRKFRASCATHFSPRFHLQRIRCIGIKRFVRGTHTPNLRRFLSSRKRATMEVYPNQSRS